MDIIGITSIDPWFTLDDDPLVKDLFYFDRLVYTIGRREILEKFCSTLPGGKEKFTAKIKEIENLEDAGLVFEYSDELFKIDLKKFGDRESILFEFLANNLANEFSTKGKPFNEVFVDFLERFREVGQLRSRVFSIILNKKEQHAFTPILRNNFHNFISNNFSSGSPVLSVILKKFPIPSEGYSIERFIEFKNDPDTKLKLSRLRNWAIEMDKSHYSEKEIEQKVDYLLNEYASQLDLYRLKHNLGFVETFITTSLEVLESIAKLKFSNVSKAIFDLQKQDLYLLEAEQKMEGRELALIHKLKENSL
jgi:hypothetical protein